MKKILLTIMAILLLASCAPMNLCPAYSAQNSKKIRRDNTHRHAVGIPVKVKPHQFGY